MSRKLRIEYPGAMYHVMNRGDRREDIFKDDEDRQRFLSTLGEACGKTDWQARAYCLMRNDGRTTARRARKPPCRKPSGWWRKKWSGWAGMRTHCGGIPRGHSHLVKRNVLRILTS